MRAIDTCEWLPGEFFLIYWMDAVMASTVVHSIEISAMLGRGLVRRGNVYDKYVPLASLRESLGINRSGETWCRKRWTRKT